MTVKFTIHLDRGFCQCFSEKDLKTNIEFALRERYRILRVEAN
jgi:hypothetical protein